MLQQTLIIFLFIVALLFYVYYGNGSLKEGFSNQRCPNVLVQKGKDFFLFNTKLARIPGVNPLQFSSLEDYKEFLDWQRSQGIKCPILYLQQSYNAQGDEIFQQRPDPFDPQGGLNADPEAPLDEEITTLLYDANRADAPYNHKSYPAFDPHNQYIGEHTPLDAMNTQAEKLPYSGDPMDSNWGGPAYTQELINRGYYSGNEVVKYADSQHIQDSWKNK
jgi:hypothetical protein